MNDRSQMTSDDVDRTGRDEEVTGRDIRTGQQVEQGEPVEPKLGAAGTDAEQPPKGHENDFA